jgi:hypothetical protein
MRRAIVVSLAMLLGLGLASHAEAAKKARDQFWTSPDYARYGIDRIALFPVTSYDNNLGSENQVEATIGPEFKSLGYRWISGNTTREMMRSATGGDSLMKALKAQVLAVGRIDSTDAQRLAKMLRCDAILALRLDRFEQHAPEFNVAGKPYTTVGLTGTLIDSKGRLDWSGSGTQTGEGPYYDPSANLTGVNDSGLERKGISGQGGPPSYHEVLAALFKIWFQRFPPKTAPPAAADSTAGRMAPAAAVADSSHPAAADSAAKSR